MSSGPYELVVFTDDWHGHPFSCKHLLSRFPQNIRIFWVELIGLRSPSLSVYDFRRALSKIGDWFSPKLNADQPATPRNVTLIRPVQIPYNQFKPVRALNKWLLRRELRKHIGAPGELKRVMLTTWPFVDNMVGDLGENVSVYYRVDDFSEFPGVDSALIQSFEKSLIAKVSGVVASAQRLLPAQRDPNAMLYLPHGVDYAHFYEGSRVPATPAGPQSRPLIGFFGLIDKWVDVETMAQVAALRPDLDFVFIGPSQIPQAELPVVANLKFSGRVAYSALPAAAASFDVGLIPFKINELTLSVNPLKLLEYFAMGMPVVSSRLPEVERFGDLVQFAGTAAEYVVAIDAALADRSPQAAEKRRQVAMDNSWDNQSRKLADWIDLRVAQAR